MESFNKSLEDFATMFSFLLLTLIALVPGALTLPNPAESVPRGAFPATAGNQAGFYYSFWSEGSGSFQCNNGNGGSYTATWGGKGGGFVCGKGWSPGGSRFAYPLSSYLLLPLTFLQSSEIQRNLHPDRTRLPRPLWLDQKPPH